jgi:hypothetical protein
MKLSIIPSDGTVCEDNICYDNLVWTGTPANIHALQWNDDAPFAIDDVTYYGWVEFNDGTPNQDISVLPAWAMNACAAWTAAANPPPPPPPTPEEIQAQNKAYASSLLQATDWTATVDIADPKYSNPYLMNQADFLAYRSAVRDIAVNPPTTPVTTWPTLPAEKWSS